MTGRDPASHLARHARLAFLGAWALQGAAALATPLVADEAYYLAWSRAPALGYFDHPPGIAWWIAAGFGHPRLLGWLATPLVAWALVRAARAFDVRADGLPLWVAWTPLGMSLGLVATPDVPCLVAWSFALWAIAARRPGWVGVCLGLALWSKSTTLIALPGVVWVLRQRAPVAIAVAGLIYAPHLAWSAQNAWLPFSFQGARALAGPHIFEAVGGQILLATPLVAGLAICAWRAADTPGERALRALGLPILAAWLALSCVTRIEANWPVLAWPATLILITPRAPRWALVATGALTAGVLLAWIGIARGLPAYGPPRDPARWARCVEGERPVAARYQERALLEAAGVAVGWLRAAGHRLSEYDRHPQPRTGACEFLFLASPAALDGRCRGIIERTKVCGRVATRCRCPGQ